MKISAVSSAFLYASVSITLNANPTMAEDNVSLDDVIENVAKHVWDGISPRRFVIKGSYPASVYAAKHAALDLPYNDVDVTVTTKCDPKEYDAYEGPFGAPVVEIRSFFDGPIPGTDKTLQVITLCEVDNLEDIITKFSDINAVSAGIIVTPNDAGEPVMEKWVITPAFENFLQTKTLELVQGSMRTPSESFVRLINKAQQMNLNYILPDIQLHGKTIPHWFKRKKVDTLESKHKDVIYNDYDLVKINRKLSMFVNKGYKGDARALSDNYGKDLDLYHYYDLFRYYNSSGKDPVDVFKSVILYLISKLHAGHSRMLRGVSDGKAKLLDLLQ